MLTHPSLFSPSPLSSFLQKKLIADIKKYAKENQMGAVKTMAKDLVRTRNYQTKFIEMRSHLQGAALKLETVRSHEAMASAMKSVTKVRTTAELSA